MLNPEEIWEGPWSWEKRAE